MTCPRCSAEARDNAKDCPSCGIIFAPEYLGITHAGWKAAVIGLAMAAALTLFPFLKFLLHPLSTLVHEIGFLAIPAAFWAASMRKTIGAVSEAEEEV